MDAVIAPLKIFMNFKVAFEGDVFRHNIIIG